ncbi:MFS transporter [Nonomuraea dietziae]|uniref:Putative MFS family arabinose efflux permease n=2 Tax=Nonomuraea dietziae TaxID=65515 RepID=A0A7W5V3K6_9ACTN|nr:MFS transporter [Nonomuraea dietziae]MBB3725668.1 putative MFS family arabinose efflux permease [Nonomuraea dietziae]
MDDDVVSTAVLDRTARLPEGDRRRWLAVVALGIGAFAIGTDMFAMAGMLGGISRDLGVTVGAAGLTVTVFALAYAIGAVLLSALLGSWPLRRVLIGSAALFGILSALSAVAPALPALLAVRVLGALAASVYVPAACAAAVAAVPASHRGRALSVILGGTATAMVLGAPLGVALASRLSWRVAFGLVAVLAGATVIALLLTRAGPGPLTRATVRERLRPMRSPAVVGVLGVTFLVMTASYSMYTYLPLQVAAGAGPLGLGLLIGAFGIGGMLGTWWGGTAADRSGPRRVILPAVAVLAVAFAALPHVATTAAGAPAVMVAWGIAAWAFVPAQQHRLIGLGAGSAPLLLALNSSAIHLGSAAGALSGGLVVDTAGVGGLCVIAVACCGAGLAVHGIFGREVLA